MKDIFTVSYVFEILQAVILVAHNTQKFHSSSRTVSCKYKMEMQSRKKRTMLQVTQNVPVGTVVIRIPRWLAAE